MANFAVWRMGPPFLKQKLAHYKKPEYHLLYYFYNLFGIDFYLVTVY
jgi:hypothetical protein